MIKLQLKFKDTLIKELIADKEEVTIGRDPGNNLEIDNLSVSGQHARIFQGPGQYAIEDLNSTNGTYVNNNRIMTHLLEDNDEISIGKHTIIVSYESQETKQGYENSRAAQSTYMLDPEERGKLKEK